MVVLACSAFMQQGPLSSCCRSPRRPAAHALLARPAWQVKAAGGVRDLDGLLLVRELGCTRLGASATKAILEEFRRRAAEGDTTAREARLGSGGY